MKIYNYHHMDLANLESNLNFGKLLDHHLSYLIFEIMHLAVAMMMPKK
jgi:hypothetical protein